MATILAIDDEADVLEIVRASLEKAGHTVLTAPDGQTGLMLTLTRQPDLVILDVMMPGIDGFEVLRRMKSEPRMTNIPVLMLTARTDYSSKSRAWEEYAQTYLTKPFDVDELTEAVTATLETRQQLQAAAADLES